MFPYSKKATRHSQHTRRLRFRLTPFLLLLVFVISAVGSLSYFSARVTGTQSIQSATFQTGDYTLDTTYQDIPFVANEDIKVGILESNSGESSLDSVISLSVEWSSPDPDCQIFGQSTASNNATFSIAGEPISDYTVSSDKSTATLTLPAHTLGSGATDIARDLLIHIPDSLMGTGTISVTFNGVTLRQSRGGFSGDIPAKDLTDRNFTVDVGWAASSIAEDNGKALMGYLRSAGAGKYTIEYVPGPNYSGSSMKDFASATASRWSHYKDSVTALSFADGVTSIGDYCFAGFTSVASASLPGSVTDIGVSAFDGSGLTGDLKIPATVTSIQSRAFANLPDVTTITFGHTSDTLTLPDNTTAGNESKGAFFVGSPHSKENPLRTKVNTSVSRVLNYDWTKDFRGYKITTTSATGGSLAVSQAVAINGKTITLTPSANAGYAYTGATVKWTEGGSAKSKVLASGTLSFQMPAADTTITPAFESVTYSISYDLAGGTVSSANPATYTPSTDTFTLNNPTKTGYTFTGWTGSNGNTPQTTVTIAKGSKGDLSYTANWKAVNLTVTFNANGGTVSTTSKSVTYGSAYGTLPTPTRSGYEFVGWFTGTASRDSSKAYKDYPMLYYADAYGDLYNAFGYNEASLWSHWVNNGKGEGRRISQYLSTDTVSATQNFTLYAGWRDTTAPSLSVTAPASSTKASSITISGTATDAVSGLSSVTVTVGGTNYNASVNSNGSWSVSVSLATGNNSISVVAKDKNGNAASASYTVRRLVYVSVYNWGTVDPTYKEAGAELHIIYTKTLASGYDKCNVLIVDGVEYEVVFSTSGGDYYWKRPSGGNPYVKYLSSGYFAGYRIYLGTEDRTYTVQMGYYQ